MKNSLRKLNTPSEKEINKLISLFNFESFEISEKYAISITQRFPKFVFGWKILAAIYKKFSQYETALIISNHVVILSPNDAEAYNNHGAILHDIKKFEEAIEYYTRAININKNYAEAFFNLGNCSKDLKKFKESINFYIKSVNLNPLNFEAYCNLSYSYQKIGYLHEAEINYKKALEINPNSIIVLNNLALVYKDLAKYDEAILILNHVINLDPKNEAAYCNLGNTYTDIGDFESAENNYRKSLAINPSNMKVFSNLLFCMNYHPDKSAEDIFDYYKEYNRLYSFPSFIYNTYIKKEDKKIKIGYISPDFRNCSAQYFLEPLLSNHTKSCFEIYAYAQLDIEDKMSLVFKSYVDQWVPIACMSDSEVAEKIQNDNINILIDTAGHSANNRLGVFAFKPAPISITWMGYGYSTGMESIDFYLTDSTTVPKWAEQLFSEKIYTIDPISWVYRPPKNIEAVSVLPALKKGYVTFGSLSRSVRLNYRTIKVWAEILHQVPNSNLIIDSSNYREQKNQVKLIEKFVHLGINKNRLRIGFNKPFDIMAEIDIGLDCFPHNSGTTLFEFLYMGVPFITLAGRPSVGRLGSSILYGLGQTDWIAYSELDYVTKVVNLSKDLTVLIEIRENLRHKMKLSNLMDEKAFVNRVESAYKTMYDNYYQLS